MGTKDKMIRNVNDELLQQLSRRTHLPQGTLVNLGLELVAQRENTPSARRKVGVLATLSQRRVAVAGVPSSQLLNEVKGER